jgi:FkbM family methyltransferase
MLPSFLKRPVRLGVQLVAAHPVPRNLLNAVYLRLTPPQRSLFHCGFAKVFRNELVRGRSGTWAVEFAGGRIRMPLTSERFWLDWDLAVSIVGHDVEIKETYSHLLKSPDPPTVFLDVGANYGTHSLLFLVHGIETISFEPNSSCHAYFEEVCEINNVTPRLIGVVLGKEARGYAHLSYPPRDTWLGSTDVEVIGAFGPRDELKTERVRQQPLDDYLAELRGKRILIKIDTEGSEYGILQGASAVLRELRPVIILECWRSLQRARLFDFLLGNQYRLAKLPWNPAMSTDSLTRAEFIATDMTNFAALPAEKH